MKKVPAILSVLTCQAFLLFLTPAFPQAAIDIKWMLGLEAYQLSNLPETQWTVEGKLILMDEIKYYFNQEINIFDPSSGKYQPLFDPEIVLKKLSDQNIELSPVDLPLPVTIDKQGEKAAFIIHDDLFLLEFRHHDLVRITNNEWEKISSVFSPDGNKIAWSMNHDLYYYDIQKERTIRITKDGSESILNATLSWVYWEEIFGREDHAFWWSEQSDGLVFLRTDETMVDKIVLQHFLPAVPGSSIQRYPKAGSLNPEVQVGIYDLKKQFTNWVDFRKHSFEYFIRADWLPGGEQIAIQTMSRDQQELDLLFVDRQTGMARHILKETDKGWVNIHDDLIFLETKKQFIWPSERTGFAHLYLYDYEGNLANPITMGDWSTSSTGTNVSWVRRSIVFVDELNNWLYFAAKKESPLENHLYRIRLDGSDMQILTANKSGDHQIDFSNDGLWYVDAFSAFDRPPALLLFSTEKESAYTLIESKSEKAETLGITTPEYFTIPARDNFPLPATMIKPPGFNNDRAYPVILDVYGGPSSPQVQNKWNPDVYWHNILANNGYIVISLDNRSATGISKKLENTILKNSPSEEIKDVIDAVSWLKKQSFIDKNRIGIWGWSSGGSFTMAAMTQSDEFKAGISVSGVSDWRFYDTKFGEMIMKTPQNNPVGYNTNSHLDNAGQLHGRIFLIHGSLDDNVHLQNSYAFADELIRSGILFDMMIYPGRDHSIADYEARMHLYRTMLDFWKMHL